MSGLDRSTEGTPREDLPESELAAGPGIPVGPGLPDGAVAPEGEPVAPEGDPVAPEGDPAADPVVTDAPDALESAAERDLTEAELEALLFVAERPLGRRELATTCGVDRSVVDARLGDLEVSLASRGIRLLVDGDRVALATAPEAGPLIGRYLGADAVRLSPAALETLAIVAYRQPVTRAAIERIRGVDSDYTVRTLLHRRLIVELGRAESPGRPYLYGTGMDFLERFGITSLEELPALDAEAAARLAEADGAASSGIDDEATEGADALDGLEPSGGPGRPVGPGLEGGAAG